MAPLSTALLTIVSLIFFFGQLARINLFHLNLPLLDALLVILALISIPKFLHRFRQQKINLYFLVFIVISFFTYIINLSRFGINLTSILFLIRLTAIFFLLSSNIFQYRYFPLFVIANVFFGLVQYFLWPDFTVFASLNWDPHTFRLVGTFFDPTFTGIIFLFLFYKVLLSNKFPLKPIILTITYVSIALTYSRSSLLCFLVGFIFIAHRRHQPRLALWAFLLVLTTTIILPRLPGESTKLERSSSIFAKIENYKTGIKLFSRSPFFGIGYNNISLVRTDVSPHSHAKNGFDGSILTLLITNGILGIVPLISGFIYLFRRSDLLHQTLLLTLFVHSLFANSLLYPWVLVALLLL